MLYMILIFFKLILLIKISIFFCGKSFPTNIILGFIKFNLSLTKFLLYNSIVFELSILLLLALLLLSLLLL